MFDPARQESPLIERMPSDAPASAPADAGVTLREPTRYGYLNLRGSPDDAAFLDAVAVALGCRPPLEPNKVSAGDAVSAIWLGPDEWYLRTAHGAERDTAVTLEQALAGQHVAINPVGSGLATLEFGGAHARDVLEKGCTLDLHPRAFGEGQCAQTLLAKANVLLCPRGAQPAYEIVVRRSLADYLFAWLTDAADEFGMSTIH